jgi:diguanylate cyclase
VGRHVRRQADLVPLPEFGPFDFLRERAYRMYVDGQYEQSLQAVAEALPLARAAGDQLTDRYLRYVACIVYEMSGQWSKLRQHGEDLLERLGPEAGPYWRAKVLAELSHALIVQGSSSAAVDSLAEAYGLITERESNAYNRGSACHVVSMPMSAALLFQPALHLLRDAQRILGARSGGDVNGAIEEAVQLATWGLFLEFLGRYREAASRYAACASAAVRGLELARSRGWTKQELQATSMLQFAYQGLDLEPVDLSAVRRYVALDSGRDALIPRLGLASARVRGGDVEGGVVEIAGIEADARRFGEPVLAWAAAAWLAELQESRDRGSESTRRWRAVALSTMERLWRDRAGRFEDLVARHRLAALSRRVEDDHNRLWEDALTGVGNRRLLDTLMAVPGATTRPVAFVDVDWFKAVNDRHGHEVGDEVLRRVAVLLQARCRTGDVVIRYGGDEFVVVLAEDGDVEMLAHRLRTGCAPRSPGSAGTTSRRGCP